MPQPSQDSNNNKWVCLLSCSPKNNTPLLIILDHRKKRSHVQAKDLEHGRRKGGVLSNSNGKATSP